MAVDNELAIPVLGHFDAVPRTGLDAIDTGALRMPFPARVRIRLRSGERIEVDGAERGAAGHPLEEQRAVVERKIALVGDKVGEWASSPA